MNVSASKENILKKIRKALSQSTPLPFPKSEGNESVFQPEQQEKEIEFAEQFTKLQGRFVFCINHQELAFQLSSLVKKMDWHKVYCLEDDLLEAAGSQIADRIVKTDLANCDVSITGCECLVARTGTIVMSAGGGKPATGVRRYILGGVRTPTSSRVSFPGAWYTRIVAA